MEESKALRAEDAAEAMSFSNGFTVGRCESSFGYGFRRLTEDELRGMKWGREAAARDIEAEARAYEGQFGRHGSGVAASGAMRTAAQIARQGQKTPAVRSDSSTAG